MATLHQLLFIFFFLSVPLNHQCFADENPATAAEQSSNPVDATSLHQKVMTGYQGWFRCPGDETDEGWLHWSRRRSTINTDTLTVEMWPDLTEMDADEKYPVPGFSYPNGQPAHLFSSANQKTVRRHFQWMQDYEIDGVFLQRFLVNLNKPSFDKVLSHVRSSARETGRTYAICYDLSGAKPDHIQDLIMNDWRRLVDEEKVTNDPGYLHHNGKPVLFVWGFFSDRFSGAVANQLIDALKSQDRYSVTLIGGVPWYWRKENDPAWANAFRRFDVICPWNVGNYRTEQDIKHATTDYWQADVVEAQKHGMEWMPVIYPGFGWTNLKGQNAAEATIPRRGGKFFWEQFVQVRKLSIPMAYVTMFDEVDEATAIFKVSNTPPIQAKFSDLEGLPSDWYLRLTRAGKRLLAGEIAVQDTIPISP